MRVSASVYAAIFDALPAHVALLDSEGFILTVNAAWRRFAAENGLESPHFGVGENYLEVCERAYGEGDEQQRVVASGIRSVLQGETLEFVREYPCHARTEQRWFRLQVTPLPAGPVEGAVVMHIDITQRKLAEEELRLHQTMLASAARIAGVGSWDYDIVHDRLGWSDVTLQIFGVRREAFGGTLADFLARVHPEDRPGLQAIEAESLAGSRALEWEYRIVRPDGRVRLLHDRGEVNFDEHGDPIRSAGAVIDITERNRNEEALRQSEEKFRTLAEEIPNIAWMSRPDGWVTYRNRRWLDYTGLTLEESYGNGWLNSIHPEDRERNREAWEQAAERGDVFECESRMLKTDGKYHWMLTRALPLRDSAGRILNWLGTSTDIEELKQASAASQRAREAAEAASQAKTDFIANMSHEIRTPLNGIIGFTDLLLDSALSPEQREYLGVVSSSAQSLLSLLSDILDFSKADAEELQLETVAFNLRETLAKTMKVFALQAKQKGLNFACHIPPNVPDALFGDPGRLKQVLVNLIANAIKFTEAGEVDVHVEVQAVRGEEIDLHVSVRDTGIGIPTEKQGLIFEPFTQADSSTTRMYGGTGLGLTIAARLISLMNGRLWMESSEGQGSKFYLDLPLQLQMPASLLPGNLSQDLMQSKRQLEMTGSNGHRQMGTGALFQQGRSLSILLAEDNDVNRIVAVARLQKEGHRVSVATTGKRVLAILEKQTFELILMDIQMPDMDGWETTAAIRRREKTLGQHTPIIALTAQAMAGDRERCLEAGMDDYVSKPLDLNELRLAIDRLLAKFNF